MRIIGAYLLAVLGGNDNPDASTINTILDSVGIKAEADQVELVISKLKGKDLNQLIEEGSKRLSSAPGGGGGGAAPAGGGAAAAAPKAEEKKEEPKKKEASEESGGDMGFSLFD